MNHSTYSVLWELWRINCYLTNLKILKVQRSLVENSYYNSKFLKTLTSGVSPRNFRCRPRICAIIRALLEFLWDFAGISSTTFSGIIPKDSRVISQEFLLNFFPKKKSTFFLRIFQNITIVLLRGRLQAFFPNIWQFQFS